MVSEALMELQQGQGVDREEQLDVVVTAYLKAVETGQNPDRELLLRQYPDLAAELKEFFAGQDQVDRLAAPLRKAGPSTVELGNTPRTGGANTVIDKRDKLLGNFGD